MENSTAEPGGGSCARWFLHGGGGGTLPSAAAAWIPSSSSRPATAGANSRELFPVISRGRTPRAAPRWRLLRPLGRPLARTPGEGLPILHYASCRPLGLRGNHAPSRPREGSAPAAIPDTTRRRGPGGANMACRLSICLAGKSASLLSTVKPSLLSSLAQLSSLGSLSSPPYHG